MLKKTASFLGIKGITVLSIFSVIVIFCLQNLETISVRFLFWELVSVPKLYLVGIATSLGVLMGVIIGWQLHRTKSSEGTL